MVLFLLNDVGGMFLIHAFCHSKTLIKATVTNCPYELWTLFYLLMKFLSPIFDRLLFPKALFLSGPLIYLFFCFCVLIQCFFLYLFFLYWHFQSEILLSLFFSSSHQFKINSHHQFILFLSHVYPKAFF